MIYHRFRNVPVVHLLVGEEETPFYVHLNMLCDASVVFKAAFCGPFKESSERSMRLPDDDVETIERMIHWLYFKYYDLPKFDATQGADEWHWAIARLNTVADKYHIAPLSNDIIDKLFDMQNIPMHNLAPRANVISYIYKNNLENSSLCKLMVAWYVWCIDTEWYRLDGARTVLRAIPEFTADLAIAFASRIQFPNQKDPFLGERSTFCQKIKEEATDNDAN